MPNQPHIIASPFPMRSNVIGTIIDEVCVCGELRSEHADTLAFGHGPCLRAGCPKFAWIGFVTESEDAI